MVSSGKHFLVEQEIQHHQLEHCTTILIIVHCCVQPLCYLAYLRWDMLFGFGFEQGFDQVSVGRASQAAEQEVGA